MKFKRENKGFSLVELVVVIAIFSVVSVAIGGFLLAAQRSYAVSANELDIQEEAQLVANQLQEMILDTPLGISYQYVVVQEDGTELIDYLTNDASVVLPEGDLTKKELYIYGIDYYYHIYWNKDTSELYFVEYEKNGNVVQLADGMTATGVVLGEFVTDFSVDLTHVAKDKMVFFDITFKKPGGDRDYTVARNISIRNNILMNKSATDVYNSVGAEFEPVASDLNIDPGSAFKWPGDSLQFNVVATCSRGGVPSQDVNWSYSSGDGVGLSADTKINASGVLQIGMDEKSTILNLVGSMPGKDYTTNTDITLSKTCVINVRQITGLSVIHNDFATIPVVPGGRYEVEVLMTGTNISGVDLDEAGDINATIEMGSSYANIVETQNIPGGLIKRFVVELSSSTPKDTEIALSFRPGRASFSDVTTSTGIYKVGDAGTKVLTLASETGMEWLRLGPSKVSLAFTNSTYEDSYCDASGVLKEGYFIRYHYMVYDSDYVLNRSAYKSTGMNGNLYTDFFQMQGTDTSQTSSTLYMSDDVFLSSGTVVVRADLMHKTAGSPSVVGSSNEISYIIPQVAVGYKRSSNDMLAGNLTMYITENVNAVPLYVAFSSGFETQSYDLHSSYLKCTPDTLATVTTTDLDNRKFLITGKEDADYSNDSGNVITLRYGDALNGVTIKMVEPNISGTDFYVPLNNSEWTLGSTVIAGAKRIQSYIYYMNDTNKMEMTYENGVFKLATYYIYENNVWKKVADYTMNRVTTGWDLVTP